jgi:predicted RNA-binding protein YlqC (UPF0109 family)
MQELLRGIARALVDEPDAVLVEQIDGDETITLKLRVAPGDVGKVIGKQGRIARAIRTVIKAMATKERQRVNLEILSDD